VVQPLTSEPIDHDLIEYPETESFQKRGRVIAIGVILAILLVSGIIVLIMMIGRDDVQRPGPGDLQPGAKAGVGPLVEGPDSKVDNQHQPGGDDSSPEQDGGTAPDKVAVRRDVGPTPPAATPDAAPVKEVKTPAKEVETPAEVRPHEKRPPSTVKTKVTQPPGKLYLHTSPWSKVRIGGRNLGTTPIAGVSLPAGSHVLRLVDADGRTHSRRVRIRPGEPTKVFINMRDVGR
jgi:serine/threonine-protein kinase